MIRFFRFIILVTVFHFSFLSAQDLSRKNINIPDILGYKTLKCDFHMHTVFSDGVVWPTLRIDEAWLDGLDAIAITDHIEYRPHKDYLTGDFNSAYAIAKNRSHELGVTLIHAAEITRSMPPGHLNALFIEDANVLAQDSFRLVVNEVKKQGGILFWNHPGWISQQPDGIAKWYDEHTWILNTGILKGLEIVNERDYYPEVQQWCLDKNIAPVGNSDTHQPTSMFFNQDADDHRTITLVFAKENSTDAIKEAIIAGRTAVWSGKNLYGKEQYLKEIFTNSIKFNSTNGAATGKERIYLELTNNSALTFELKLAANIPDFQFPETIRLKAGETVVYSFRAAKSDLNISKKIDVVYDVLNLFPEPNKPLQVTFKFNIEIKPKK